ncbi:MAG: CZB domain-containing protein [Magnetococcales bacterium]|nr:CZB domain-containing protein [Magnetococcales bacterium]
MWGGISLGKKLFFGVAIVLLLLVIVGGWSLKGISQIVDDGMEVVAGNRLKGEILQREVEHLNWVNRINAFITNRQIKEIDVQLDHTKCGFGKWYYGDGRHEAELLVPELKTVLASIEEPHKRLHVSARKIKEAYKNTDPNLPGFLAGREEAETILATETQTQLAAVKQHFHELVSITSQKILTEKQMLTNATDTKTVVITVSILAIILGAVMGVLFVTSLRKLLLEVVNNIVISSSQISTTINEQERISAMQATSINETSTTMEELGRSARQSSEQADSAAKGAQSAMDFANQGVSKIEATLRSMESAKDRVDIIAQQMLLLSEQAGQIRQITEMVSDFASETKMLAMNAAVEAVRAGEHGKGFAVLAVETRKLADESKSSTELINGLVKSINKATDVTVIATKDGSKTVEDGIDIAHGTAETFQNVNEAIYTSVEGVQQISMNVRQQSTAIKQVVEAIKSINIGAKETSSVISQVKVGVENLNQSAKTLHKMV